MARTTNAELSALINRITERTGVTFSWDAHNSKGYGVLYIPSKVGTGISNQIAGNMWEGVTKREAACILRAIENLLAFGADLSAINGRIK